MQKRNLPGVKFVVKLSSNLQRIHSGEKSYMHGFRIHTEKKPNSPPFLKEYLILKKNHMNARYMESHLLREKGNMHREES